MGSSPSIAQLGLFVDFSPDGAVNVGDDDDNDADLEAELLAITGGTPAGKAEPKGKAPLPMEDIERMAALCMKDLDEEGEDDDDVENDNDLMAELNEVLGDDEVSHPSKPSHLQTTSAIDSTLLTQVNSAPADSGGLDSTLAERISMYKTAITHAKQAGEGSKVRRYERGLKTLETMLTSVKKGKKISEEEIPPPVASGQSGVSLGPPSAVVSTPSPKEDNLVPNEQPRQSTEAPAVALPCSLHPAKPPVAQPAPVPVVRPTPPPVLPKPKVATAESACPPPSRPAELQVTPTPAAKVTTPSPASATTTVKFYSCLVFQKFDLVLEALDRGEPVDLSNMPPSPGRIVGSHYNHQLSRETPAPVPQRAALSPTATPASQTSPALSPATSGIRPPPKDMMEALQQRMDKYKAAAAQAKSSGNDRKARMHERIVKQYQDAIRAHKLGKPVEFSELPVPPGFPPIQGMEGSTRDQSIMGVLETAMKLANEEDGDKDEETEAKPAVRPGIQRPAPAIQPKPQVQQTVKSASVASAGKEGLKLSTKAQQQLDFLQNRKKQFLQAALRAKQKNDMEGAKMFLRQSKGLDPMIEAAKGGLPVDITKVPQPPVNEEDFKLHRRGVQVPQKTAEQYVDIMNVLKQQHETCMKYSKQFTHLGSVSETTKFEKMAEDCKKNIEILKQAHAKGFPLPKYHYEERTFQVIKIFPNLTSNDMILCIVKGINLPAPSGVAPNDLDAFVRFEFHYPNAEEAQKDKTNTVKNTNSPEFKEEFKLTINRGHRGFKRVIQTKGIKFEIVHKGGLFKNDRVAGTAQLKLDALETKCEIREILDVLEGRKATGGRLEVIVRIREPLSSQQLETAKEKWLVIDPLTLPAVAVPKSRERSEPVKNVGSSCAITVAELLYSCLRIVIKPSLLFWNADVV
ncbi:coiled-coil and C2 domain-containing protein 1A [Latimeria chalumnae]|uniref:coiled-coil and C2 domain-containing protein 1A n=1 Tax=Latimeria chalumnae TaxID=7897 RepID=UPI00313A8603